MPTTLVGVADYIVYVQLHFITFNYMYIILVMSEVAFLPAGPSLSGFWLEACYYMYVVYHMAASDYRVIEPIMCVLHAMMFCWSSVFV